MRRRLCIVLVLSFVASVCAARPASAADVVLRPPTDAPILDPFRVPDGAYGPGNRGIEYATAPGAPIVAAAAGVVVFAGPVAGSLHVTVDHGSGLRSSYSFVDSIVVRRGVFVAGGDLVARADGPFHFGTRIDGVYVDPATLFGRRHVAVFLVPHDDPERRARWLDLQERSERIEYLWWRSPHGSGSSLGGALRVVGDMLQRTGRLDGELWADAEQLLDDLVQITEMVSTSLIEGSPTQLVTSLADAAMAVFWPPPCTRDEVTPVRPRGRRIAIVLDGLGSSSGAGESMAQLDLGRHGYAAADTARFSYAGGLVDDGLDSGWQADVPESTYGVADTYGHIETMIDRFERTLLAVAEANPGVQIDVFGHSLGGLVARHAISAVGGPDGPVMIGVAVTLGSPHAGAPLAEASESVTASRGGRGVAAGLDILLPETAVGTPIMEDLSVSGFAGDTADVAFPEGLHAVAIADRGDLVVPASASGAPGARTVVVGGLPSATAHSDLPGHADVVREVELALGGLPPACTGVVDRLADALQPKVIEVLEHQVAGAILIGGVGRTGP